MKNRTKGIIFLTPMALIMISLIFYQLYKTYVEDGFIAITYYIGIMFLAFLISISFVIGIIALGGSKNHEG